VENPCGFEHFRAVVLHGGVFAVMMSGQALEMLHPLLRGWVDDVFEGRLTEAQERTLPLVMRGRDTLLSSPTGSGKTLAGFLGVLDHLIRLDEEGELPANRILALYVSPLRALTYDMEKNLARPLRDLGLQERIRIGLRTGDTSGAERARQRRRPPHILLTTPESLAILLPQKSARETLAECRFVVVDELHALAENKRGAHLAVSLERLDRVCRARRPVRVGLSATAAPMELLGGLLAGAGRECELVTARIERTRRVEVLSPLRRDPYPPAGYTAQRVLEDVAGLVKRHRSVIVFCNTRSATESLSLRLKQALPELAGQIEAHHASLDRDVRLEVEDRLKNGELRAVVCSTSLELGVDIGFVDCVVMISTPKGVSRAVQRVGRSGHALGRPSHGVLVATNVNDLMECVVCAEMTRELRLDEVRLADSPLDVLAQHLTGMAVEGGWTVEEAFAAVRRALPFAGLERAEFNRVLRYLLGGGAALEAQYADVFGKVRVEDGWLKAAGARVEREHLANVGVIHTEGMVDVKLGRRRLGQLEETFLKRLRTGDVFVLAGRMVRLVECGIGEARVEEARMALPTVPAWNANKMPLASGLAAEVRGLRTELAERFARGEASEEMLDWLVERFEISASNAGAILRHCRNQLRVSLIPTARIFLIERYEEPAREGGAELTHFFFHSLIGRAANDALSRIVAWRAREAAGGSAMVTIDDYGFILTLRRAAAAEFGLEEWRWLFAAQEGATDLEEALRDSELVRWNFRGVAQTGMLVPRNLPGRERKLRHLRWNAEILWQVLNRHEPDHPMVRQARREATHTFLDLPRAEEFLRGCGEMEWRLREVPVVSPFAFGMYASKIKEGMMLEDPEAAIERLWREFEAGCEGAFACSAGELSDSSSLISRA
jgi:ATP-dependent Lhr-like helicase